MHPIIPFVTEELWHAFPFGTELLERTSWPKPRVEVDDKVLQEMGFVQELIRSIRNLRAEAHIPPQQQIPEVTLIVHSPEKLALIRKCEKQICLLTKVETISLYENLSEKPQKSLASVLDDLQVYLPVGALLDVEKEVLRLKNDLGKLEKDIEKSRKKLANEQFVERAPAEVIEKERNTLADNETRALRMKENLKSLAD